MTRVLRAACCLLLGVPGPLILTIAGRSSVATDEATRGYAVALQRAFFLMWEIACRIMR